MFTSARCFATGRLVSCRASTSNNGTPSSLIMSHPISVSAKDEGIYPHSIQPISQLTMEKILPRLVGDISVDPNLGQSQFVKPQSIYYHLDGKKKKWDMVVSHASTACILYHKTLHAAVVVRQFRPPVYVSACKESGKLDLPITAGFTFELCAGILDKTKSVAQIAKEEILEECGFDVKLENIEEVSSFVSASGTSGSRQYMFFAEVDDSMKVADAGGGVDGEAIEVCAVPFNKIDDFVKDATISKSPGLMFGLTWMRHIRLAHLAK